MVNSFVFIVIAVMHCFYSFVIPFIYRIVFIDEDNWTLRFQVTTLYGMCMCMCMACAQHVHGASASTASS